MGYYTNHTLFADHPEKHEEIWEYMEAEVPDAASSVADLEGGWSDSAKWYEAESDMQKLSEKFPEVTFELRGEGEEALDIWEKHWKGGEVIHQDDVEVNLARYAELLEACKRLVKGNNPDLTAFRIKTLLDKWGELK